MSYAEENGTILKTGEIAERIFDFTLFAPEIAKLASPGQFVHIKCPGLFLRRPISICDADKEKGTVRIVFEVRGEGTLVLSRTAAGESVDLLGPLGRGFTVEKDVHAIFIGGGIGVPPLLMAAKYFGDKATVSLGFRSKNKMILKTDFEALGCSVRLSTDDGSIGLCGNAVDAIGDITDVGIVYACGPTPMLKSAAEFAQNRNIPCEVSLESRMGCGVGACLVCACKTKSQGEEHYSRACKDGPVFDSREVVL